MSKATMTTYYSRTPKAIEVEDPDGYWPGLRAFLISLGFRRVRLAPGVLSPGKFEFLTGSTEELDCVRGIVQLGGKYLTSGNFDGEAFSI